MKHFRSLATRILCLVATASKLRCGTSMTLRANSTVSQSSRLDGKRLRDEEAMFWERKLWYECQSLAPPTNEPTPEPTEQPTPTTINPPLNSVIAAHGNVDWNPDTANEFLFGTELPVADDVDAFPPPTAFNHAPDDWIRAHIHVGETNTAHYYYDESLTSSGDDTSLFGGIDRAMLFFYTGHGNSDGFSALGEFLTPANVKVGNSPASLRYFWQCSCKTFAHGPKDCPGNPIDLQVWDHSCPGEFVQGSSDSFLMRNVYERWGHAIGSDLRMACGSSTEAYCHENNVDRLWDNYNNVGMGVADTFIDGLSGWGVVPLCMTTGGRSPFMTSLYQDTIFTNEANPSGDWFHIQYLGVLDTMFPGGGVGPITSQPPRPAPAPPPTIQIPEELPRLGLGSMVTGDAVGSISGESGAMYVQGEQVPSRIQLSEAEYFSIATQIIDDLGWTEQDIGETPEIKAMWLESYPRNVGSNNEIQTERVLKSVKITFFRIIEIDGFIIPADLGTGGYIAIQLNSDGSLLRGSKVWRTIFDDYIEGGTSSALLPTKPYFQAEEEAKAALGENAAFYILDNWEWGYKEEAGNVVQTDMDLYFRFYFRPVIPEILLEFPPQSVEIFGFLAVN